MINSDTHRNMKMRAAGKSGLKKGARVNNWHNTDILMSEERLLEDLYDYLNDLYHIYDNTASRLKVLEKYRGSVLKMDTSKNAKSYYSAKFPGTKKLKYLGGEDNKDVIAIQEARYNDQLLNVVRNDIILIEEFLGKIESVSFKNVTNKLPKAYRNKKAFGARSKKAAAKRWKQWAEEVKSQTEIIRPEELIHRTVDGNYVRSKSELSIYNYLFEAGYTFVYELPLKCPNRTFYPDFAILSEIDYQTVIYIEHQGAMGAEGYREKAEAREADYWENGYLPMREVYFTYDDNKGALDSLPIKDILKIKIRPDHSIKELIKSVLPGDKDKRN